MVLVVEVGKNIEIPKNSILHDKTGQYIYPLLLICIQILE